MQTKMVNSNNKKPKKKFKWIIGIAVSMLAAGGGIVEILKYIKEKKVHELEILRKEQEHTLEIQKNQEKRESELRQEEKIKDERYKKELKKWEDFTPESFARRAQTTVLRAATYLNLETGNIADIPEQQKSDITFSRGGNDYDYLRASKGVSWLDVGVVNFDKIKYREIRDAKYLSVKNNKSGYTDLFYAYGSGVPSKGYVYFIKTIEGNVAKIKITGYNSPDKNPKTPRDVVIIYEVFPVVKDPSKPKK